MKRLFNYLHQTDKIWRMIWLITFAGFITLDLFFPNFFGVTFLKLLGIGLCLVYVVQKYYNDHLLQLAFAATFIADLFLAVNNTSIFGVFVFAVAQFLHFSRLKQLSKKVIILIALVITFVFIIFSAFGPYSIVLMGAIYAFFLISNLILAHDWYKKSSRRKEKSRLRRPHALSGQERQTHPPPDRRLRDQGRRRNLLRRGAQERSGLPGGR